MIVLDIPEGIDEPIPARFGRSMEGGKSYLCTNAFAGVMLLSKHRVMIEGKEWALRLLLKARSIESERFDPDKDWNDKDVWFYRGGGYGDLLMLTPLIRELRNRWPKIRIHVACADRYQDALGGSDVIFELLPIPHDEETRIDCLIEFEEIVEGDPKARELHIAELFANRAGITLTTKKPFYRVSFSENLWVMKEFPRNHLPRVGIQFMASALYRTYPKMDAVMLELSKKAEVFLIGTPGQIELTQELPNITNLMDRKLSFRQSAALISMCDVCVSPDSILVHLCSALDVPCVCLYGPIPSHLRSSSSVAYSFNGVAQCAPCFFHADVAEQFPTGMPCQKAGKCIALDSISVEDIVNRVMKIVNTLSLKTDANPRLGTEVQHPEHRSS